MTDKQFEKAKKLLEKEKYWDKAKKIINDKETVVMIGKCFNAYGDDRYEAYKSGEQDIFKDMLNGVIDELRKQTEVEYNKVLAEFKNL